MNNRSRGVKLLQKFMASALAALVSVICIVTAYNPTVNAYIGQPVLQLPTLDEVECTSYCVYDKTAGTILLSKVCHNRIFPASMTKIMTAQLGFDYLEYGEDDYLTVSQNAIDNTSSDSTLMNISVGEVVKVSELFYGMMLPSGNDAANVVAEGVIEALFRDYPAGGDAVGPDGVNAQYFVDRLGLTEEEILSDYKLTAFAELMNLRAENIGCLNTHFVNAHGLHDDQHYTTSSDLTLIMARACENPDFCTVISSPTHIFEATNYHVEDGWSIVTNTNKILSDPWLCATLPDGTDTHIAAFIGGKTGTTSRAGTCMTTYSVNENGHELFVSVCGISEYSNQTRYVASVVAYGQYACWESDPVTVLPGTTSDYRNYNTTAAELPQYDPLVAPFDELPDYYGFEPEETIDDPVDEAVPDDNAATTDGDVDVAVPATDDSDDEEEVPSGFMGKLQQKFYATELGKFVEKNQFISGVVVSLTFLIIVLLIVLIVRTVRNNNRTRRRGKARPYKGRLDTFDK